jgi:hypothetical protein
MIKEILQYRIGVGQLVAIALIIGIPYGIIGLIWALTHTEHLAQLDGIDQVFSFIGEVIAWPPLVISDITLK